MRPQRRVRHGLGAVLGVIVFGTVAVPGRLEAAWVVDPSGRLEVRGDDNVRLSPVDEQEGIVSSVTGQLALRQVTERSEVAALLGASYVDYSEVDLENEDIEFAAFRGRWTGERLTYGLRGSVRRDVLLRTAEDLDDFEDLLEDGAGIPDDDIDVGSVEEQIRRIRTRIRPYVDFTLGQRSTLGLAYQYFANDYDDDAEANVQDGEQHEVTLQLERRYTERTTGRVAARAGRFDPEFSEEVDSYEVVFGVDRDFSERLWGSLEVGARRAEADESSDTGAVLRLEGIRRFESGNLAARFEQSLVPSPFGDLVERARLGLSYERALTLRTGLTLRASGYRIDRTVDEESSDRDFAEFESRLERDLSESWAVGVSYRYRWVDREDQVDSTSGNAVSLFLSFEPPSAI